MEDESLTISILQQHGMILEELNALADRYLEKNRAERCKVYQEMQQRFGYHKFPEETIKREYAGDMELQKAAGRGLRYVDELLRQRIRKMHEKEMYLAEMLIRFPDARDQIAMTGAGKTRIWRSVISIMMKELAKESGLKARMIGTDEMAAKNGCDKDNK